MLHSNARTFSRPAGIQTVHPIEEFPFADWKKILAIHLVGAFVTTKACVKYMYKQNSGAGYAVCAKMT